VKEVGFQTWSEATGLFNVGRSMFAEGPAGLEWDWTFIFVIQFFLKSPKLLIGQGA